MIPCSVADTVKSLRWTAATVTLDELLDLAHEAPVTKNKGSHGALFPGVLKSYPGRRRDENIAERTALLIDWDAVAVDWTPDDVPWSSVAWETWQSAPGAPRYRVVIPLDRPYTAAESPGVEAGMPVLLAGLGLPLVDSSCLSLAQCMYMPERAPGVPTLLTWDRRDRPVLSVDDIMSRAGSLPEPRSSRVYDSPPSEILHPVAERLVARELTRLDTMAEEGWAGEPWDLSTFEAACNLIEIQNSNWAGYLTAQEDFLAHAPRDEEFDPMRKWESALRRIGDSNLPAPADPHDDFEVIAGEDPTRPELFADVALFLSGDAPTAPARIAGHRTDGEGLFYEGQVNLLFGDPESGKTWIALASAAAALDGGRRVVCLDMDHNGLAATVGRLRMLGAPVAALTDRSLFRYIEPDDVGHLRAIVAALVLWRPEVAVVDSVGELLPLLGLSSNSPDDFTVAHATALKPLARAGAAVIAIDHLAKNSASRDSGPTGTNAKRRAVGGVALRVVVSRQFTPGHGGRAMVLINKDRHGGVRSVSAPPEKGEPLAGVFMLDQDELGISSWRIAPPPRDDGDGGDVTMLAQLEPPAGGIADVKSRMGWGQARAKAALEALRELQ